MTTLLRPPPGPAAPSSSADTAPEADSGPGGPEGASAAPARRGIRLKALSGREPGVRELIGSASQPHPAARAAACPSPSAPAPVSIPVQIPAPSSGGHDPEALRAMRRYLEETRDLLLPPPSGPAR